MKNSVSRARIYYPIFGVFKQNKATVVTIRHHTVSWWDISSGVCFFTILQTIQANQAQAMGFKVF